jgi:phage/conjugal plasmid C-4 type zinc finger TraR family protein
MGVVTSYLNPLRNREIGHRRWRGVGPRWGVHDQIDDTIKDAVMSARARIPTGKGVTHCLEWGDEIPEARRRAMPGVRTCIMCQSALDHRPVNAGFSRRGNKDSQLR